MRRVCLRHVDQSFALPGFFWPDRVMAVAIGTAICHVSGTRRRQIAQAGKTARSEARNGRPGRRSRKRSDPIPSWIIQ